MKQEHGLVLLANRFRDKFQNAMGCFQINSELDGWAYIQILFYLLSLRTAFSAFRLGQQIKKDWSELKLNPVTGRKWALTDQAAFLLAVPPAVLVHEIFHAIPIYMWGGRVDECGYGFYWGFVGSDHSFSPEQDWFISLAGTLGSLLIGLLYWLALRKHKFDILRFFGLRAFRFQLYFSLLMYPIFTAFTFIGDWRTIYNFNETPILSGATAVIHLTLLALYFWADRSGRFEMVAHENLAEQETFAQLQEQATLNPQDATIQLQLIEALRRGRASNRAKRQLKQFLQQNDSSGEAHLMQALLELENKRTIPKTAFTHSQRALQLGIKDSQQQAVAHHILGQYYLNKEAYTEAIQSFTQIIALSQPESNQIRLAEAYRGRGVAYRRQTQYDLAYQDVQQAVKIAQKLGNNDQVQSLHNELQIIEQHAGRPLGPSATKHEGGDG